MHDVPADSCLLHRLRQKIVGITVTMAPHPKGTSSGDADASPSGRSMQRQGDKRSAAADLIASHAPLRGGRHTARQNGPKHYPGDSRGRSPLARLSPLSFVVQRKMEPPEGVGIVERLVKTQNLKTIRLYNSLPYHYNMVPETTTEEEFQCMICFDAFDLISC